MAYRALHDLATAYSSLLYNFLLTVLQAYFLSVLWIGLNAFPLDIPSA